VLLTKMKILPSLQTPGTLQLAAQVHWLACADVCIPGKAQLNLEVVVGDTRQLAAAEILAEIKQAQVHLPVPPAAWVVQAFDQGATGLLRFQSEKFGVPATAQVDFFPTDGTLLSASRPRVDRQQHRLEFTLSKSAGASQPLTRIQGVAVNSHGWGGPGSAQALRLDLPAQPAPPPAPRWVLLDPPLSALLGGVLILYLVRRLYLVAKGRR
jgi:thiol:disulfide interchange protein DsbD